MGNEENYVDLRVLMITPVQVIEDLLHVALENFHFARFCEAHDLESASDQLMFNGFDLVIVSGLSNGRLREFVETVRSGVLGNSANLPMQVFCTSSDCEASENVHVSPADLDLHQITQVLKSAFQQAHRFQNRMHLAHSRLLRQSQHRSHH